MKDNILICAPNWLGDSVMSMPAIQIMKRRNQACRITMLSKQRFAPLWRMHPCVDDTVEILENPVGTFRTARDVRRRDFEQAIIFPNSFRSALIPWLAGVPVRTGMAGHHRAWMLTRTVVPAEQPDRRHEAWEFIGIATDGDDAEVNEMVVPCLSLGREQVAEASGRLGISGGGPWAGLIPGAARGPSKRWPAEYFAEVGRSLADSGKCAVIVFGIKDELVLCDKVAQGIGKNAVNLAGKTSLHDLAVALSLCRVVVTNDSGGMHLAAAVGSKVVAVFGITDPAMTGPIGAGHKVIFDERVPHARDINRYSSEARESLQSIKPDRVLKAAMELLETPPK